MRKLFMAICAIAVTAAMASCGGSQKPAESAKSDAPKTEAQAPAAEEKKADTPATDNKDEAAPVDLTKKYVCPARDYSADEPGQCPKCGMDLEEGSNF